MIIPTLLYSILILNARHRLAKSEQITPPTTVEVSKLDWSLRAGTTQYIKTTQHPFTNSFTPPGHDEQIEQPFQYISWTGTSSETIPAYPVTGLNSKERTTVLPLKHPALKQIVTKTVPRQSQEVSKSSFASTEPLHLKPNCKIEV